MKSTALILTGFIIYLLMGCNSDNHEEEILMSGTFNVNLRVHSKKYNVPDAGNDFWPDDLLSSCPLAMHDIDVYYSYLNPNLIEVLPADDKKIETQTGSIIKRDDDLYHHYSIDITINSPTTEMITKTIVAWPVWTLGYSPEPGKVILTVDYGKTIIKDCSGEECSGLDYLFISYDTIQCLIKQEGNVIICEKIWVNDVLKWEKGQGIRPVVDCRVFMLAHRYDFCFVEPDPDWDPDWVK